jgi:hypothetical protein
MQENDSTSNYRQILSNDEHLAIFMRAMKKFDRAFVDALAANEDFTLKLEVCGTKGRIVHACVNVLGFERPSGVDESQEHAKRGVNGRKPASAR